MIPRHVARCIQQIISDSLNIFRVRSSRYVVAMKLLFLAILFCGFFIQAQAASTRRCPRTNSKPFRYCTDKCDPSSSTCGKDESCLCDDDCGFSCVPNGLNCGKPRGIRNGKVRSNSSRFGGIAVFRCNKPYTLTGTKRQRCSAIKQWTGKQARCKIICGDPGGIKAGTKEGASFREGDKILYRCYPGFVLDGKATLTCTNTGQWNAKKPTCKVTSCPTPLVPTNMKIIRPRKLPSSFQYDVYVYYACLPGYYRDQGDPRRKCGIKEWSKLTLECKPKTCGDPETPVNGKKFGYQYTFKKRVTYSCNAGYKLVGSRQRQCQAHQAWTGSSPTCKVVDCGSLPDPANGKKISETKTTYNGEVVFECEKQGYEMHGSKVRSCRTDGKWSGSTTTCELVNCGDPGTPANGNQDDVTKDYRYTGSVTFGCNTNYTLVGSKMIVCRPDKSWSGVKPHCAAPCPDPGHPDNGSTVGNDFGHEKTIQFECLEGFFLVGKNSSTCQNGFWSRNRVPKCLKLCSDPGQPINGRRLDGNFSVGQIVRFRCDLPFFRNGPRAIQCRGDGSWDNTIPHCSKCDASLPINTREEGTTKKRYISTFELDKAKVITRLKLKWNVTTDKDFYIRIYTSEGWTTYREEDEDKYFLGASRQLILKEPFIAKRLRIKSTKSNHKFHVESLTIMGCNLPTDSYDCILIGSNVWVNQMSPNKDDKRTVYQQEQVQQIQMKEVKVPSRKRYTKEIIPNIIPTKNMLKYGTQVIAKPKDGKAFYGGTIVREVERSQWQIQSHRIEWISRLKDIRVIEQPEYCF